MSLIPQMMVYPFLLFLVPALAMLLGWFAGLWKLDGQVGALLAPSVLIGMWIVPPWVVILGGAIGLFRVSNGVPCLIIPLALASGFLLASLSQPSSDLGMYERAFLLVWVTLWGGLPGYFMALFGLAIANITAVCLAVRVNLRQVT